MILYTLVPVWILLLVEAGRPVEGLGPCQVDCQHYGSVLGDKADDPFDCNKYYVCFNWYEWSELSFNCPSGEKFDTVTKQCMKEGYKCSEPCQKCSYDCNNPIMEQAATFSNCSHYMQCNMGDGTPATCPPERPYFDGQVCQDDYKKCCSCKPVCNAHDAENHVQLPDYSNCTNFYLCVTEGVPDETSHGHCPSGNFNHDTGTCDENALCSVNCINAPPDDGCVDTFICERPGYFPRCTKICDPGYFFCGPEDVGSEAQLLECTNHFVLDPIEVVCILPEDCPV